MEYERHRFIDEHKDIREELRVYVPRSGERLERVYIISQSKPTKVSLVVDQITLSSAGADEIIPIATKDGLTIYRIDLFGADVNYSLYLSAAIYNEITLSVQTSNSEIKIGYSYRNGITVPEKFTVPVQIQGEENLLIYQEGVVRLMYISKLYHPITTVRDSSCNLSILTEQDYQKMWSRFDYWIQA